MSDVIVTVNDTVTPVAITIIEGAGSAPAWGGITGAIANQTDLQAALAAKQNSDILVNESVNFTITTESVVVCINTSAINVTLPSAASVPGKRIMVIQQNTGSVVVIPSGIDTINGLASYVIAAKYSVLEILSTSLGWIII